MLVKSNKLANVQFDLTFDNIQGCWNDFENKLITVVDEILPVWNHCNDVIIAPHCPFIKHKLNLRKRLLKSFHKRPTLDLKLRIKNLNIEIQNYFFSQKKQNIRKRIKPGNTKFLWNAVNASKGVGSTPLPNVMLYY